MATRADIEQFLAQKRFLMVGVSRNPKDFTRALFREFVSRGYDVVPVNPNGGDEVDGVKCLKRIGEANPPADAALITTKPEPAGIAALECAEAGVKTIWMYRAAGKGAVNRQAAEQCRERGVRVIEGECPFMFLENPGFPHNFHAFCKKIFGSYPR
jgi:uncharacterized protein